ncbi:KOW domain-containing RNA-binding protein [Miniphocaeibacter halophilus]|uniref:KOW domain-containing RNA-binding protein n=1 Tax=Miniphocaeibacter halophilus TaxID=2931922 RepID=A0AC61MRX6_9FIRM|nr:KOW domain-containing RNA-binding protein [Miniphocaeibacter halophilus]QQK07068.1 KOW domain-containing RNA-binding protein [Miniphocaeibacter halophilus]
MDQYKELVIGQVVRSIKGRDKGRIQLVLDLLDESHVLVVDGKRRKLENPKKKKIKHLQKTNTVLTINKDINDCKIRKMLKAFENKEEVH